MPVHVSSTCAHQQEVKIALHSLWYHHIETSEWSKSTKIQFYKYEQIVVKFMCEFFGCDYCVLLTVNMLCHSWVKRKPTWCHLFYYFIHCSFSAQHVSAVNTTIFRSLRLIGCYFMGSIWFGVCWRSVSVWSIASDCIKTPHRHSHTETERQHTPNQIQPMK